MKQLGITFLFSLLLATAWSQQRRTNLDTTKPTTVVVTSAFKPVLRMPAKINFSAATPAADTARPNLFYTIPSQNLFFTYQPTALQPLALKIDTGFSWQNSSYIKLGYGNFTSPYLRTGLTFGDGENSIVNLHARHISSKGQLPYQQFGKTNITGIGIFNAKNNNEWNAKAHFDLDNQYLYGFQPDSLKFNKDSLKQRFGAFGARIGFRNKAPDAPVYYNPSIGVEFFNDNRSGNETEFNFILPISKNFGEVFGLSVGLNGFITSLKLPGSTIDNNLYYLDPALHIKYQKFRLTAGFTPSWDNSAFKLLPNFSAEAKVAEEQLVVQAGWIGYFHRNTYRSLAAFNPWIAQPQFSNNTRILEQYAGFKGSAGNHLTYSGRVSRMKLTNTALFINDTLDGKTFNVVNEPSLNNFKIHGEVGYTIQEKFSFLAGITFNRYSNLGSFDYAYGLLPLELSGSLRWMVLKDLHFTSDLFFWDGTRYRVKNEFGKLKPAVDLNAGLELGIIPKLSGWLQFNNIFNSDYQRWNQYRVLGFNVLGGIVYSF